MLGSARVSPSHKILLPILYKYSLREKQEHERRDNEIWVTDLIRCPLKREYEMSYPELTLANLLNPVLSMGEMVHIGMEKIITEVAEEIGVLKDIEIEKEVSREYEVGDEVYVIKGRIDVYAKRQDGTPVVIEIKNSRRLPSEPYQHHVEQVLIYNWLVGAKEGYILYITPDGFKEYCVSGAFTDADIVERIRSAKAPRYEWECDYCVFRSVCSHSVSKKNSR